MKRKILGIGFFLDRNRTLIETLAREHDFALPADQVTALGLQGRVRAWSPTPANFDLPQRQEKLVSLVGWMADWLSKAGIPMELRREQLEALCLDVEAAWSMVEGVRELARNGGVDLLIVNADYAPPRRAAALAAKECGIPVVSIEHGLFAMFPDPEAYRPSRRPFVPKLPDLLVVDNPLEELWHQRLESTWNEKGSAVRGLGMPSDHASRPIPREDARRALELEANSPVILIPMTWVNSHLPSLVYETAGEGLDFYTELFDAVVRVAPEATLLFKVHPALAELEIIEGIHALLREMARERGLAAPRLQVGRGDECLAAADLLVCPNTTSMIMEAFERDRPSIVSFRPSTCRTTFRPEALPTANELARRSLAFHVRDGKELESALREVLLPDFTRGWLERAQALRAEKGIDFRTTAEKCAAISRWVAEEAPAAEILVPATSRWCPDRAHPEPTPCDNTVDHSPRVEPSKHQDDLLKKTDSLCAEGKLEEALAMVADQPAHPEFLKRTGSILFALGRHAEATVQFHLLASMAPDDLDAHGSLAALSLLRGDMERAETHLSRILERAPEHAESLFGMLRVRATQGDRPEAARFGRRFLEAAPEDPRCADVRSLVGSWTAATTTDSVSHRGGHPEVSIIIPVHGRLDLTQQCLKSLEGTIDHSATEIVVVDDASPDGTDSWLREQVSAGRLKAIFLPGNGGFSKACNAGARLAAGRDLVFLNNDTIARAGWLEALRDDMRTHPECGLAGARLLYPDGRIQHAGIAFGENRVPDHPFRFAPADAPEVTTSGEVPAVTGACILVPADFFASIGGFDEAYPLYVEDVDLCMKVWEAGRSVRYVAQSVLVHLEGSSSTDLSARAAKSRAGLERMWSLWNDRWPEPVRQHPWAPSWQRRKMPSPAAPVAFPSGTAIRWSGPMFNFSGYGRLAREAVAGLMDFGVPVTADPLAHDPLWFKGISESHRARWTDLLGRVALPGFLVCCDLPRDARGTEVYDPIEEANPGCSRKVCWTMFETDRLPPGWAGSLNKMDEVWVPSSFNRQTFAAAGVDAAKIHVVPGGIDPAPYANARPMALPGHKRGTTFLSVFQWIRRKGWDVLLRAWAEAFAPNADVRLVLRCHPFGKPASEMRRIFDDSLRGLGLTESGMAPIVLLDGFVPESELPSLYAASDVFVLPSRGEGWGLPYLEAMAAGKPCIATAWGASMEFLNEDCAWLVPPREPVPVGDAACLENPYLSPDHRWADPSPVELAQILRHAFEHPEEGRAKGRQGRLHATSKWTPARTARAIADRISAASIARSAAPLDPVGQARVSDALAKVASGLRHAHHTSATSTSSAASPESSGPFLSIRWEGSQFVHHSLAHVNRQLCLHLAKKGHDLSLIPFEPDQFGPGDDADLSLLAQLHNAPLEGPCQVHVRHQWPPNLEGPSQGRWVVIQPWEFGSPPKEWIPVFSRQVDELWAYTNHVRDMYLAAGVPADKVFVVPLGVDCDKFRPDLPPFALATRKTFKFLFVGGTIARKGFDVLLNAWKQAFGPHDDVCLVVKDMGGGSFYKGQTAKAWIREMQDSRRYAEIEYLDGDLEPRQIPSLYAGCDVLVHPYRGEGFGLPIAEAMACGLPCIVTRGGAADDFCGEAESWGVQAERVPVPGGKVGPFETVSEPWWLEPSVPHLVDRLREAFSDNAARQAKGKAARERIANHFTWEQAATIAEQRLMELVRKEPNASRPSPGKLTISSLDKLARSITMQPAMPKPSNAPASKPPEPEDELEEMGRMLLLAEASAARGGLAEADRITEDVVGKFPRQNMAWLARAMVLRGLGRFKKAADAIAKALQVRETPEALLEAMQIHLLADEAAPARKAEKALKERHAAWFKATREEFRAAGKPWPPDFTKPTKKAKSGPSARPVKK